jgi:hypothetical protein
LLNQQSKSSQQQANQQSQAANGMNLSPGNAAILNLLMKQQDAQNTAAQQQGIQRDQQRRQALAQAVNTQGGY